MHFYIRTCDILMQNQFTNKESTGLLQNFMYKIRIVAW